MSTNDSINALYSLRPVGIYTYGKTPGDVDRVAPE